MSKSMTRKIDPLSNGNIWIFEIPTDLFWTWPTMGGFLVNFRWIGLAGVNSWFLVWFDQMGWIYWANTSSIIEQELQEYIFDWNALSISRRRRDSAWKFEQNRHKFSLACLICPCMGVKWSKMDFYKSNSINLQHRRPSIGLEVLGNASDQVNWIAANGFAIRRVESHSCPHACSLCTRCCWAAFQQLRHCLVKQEHGRLWFRSEFFLQSGWFVLALILLGVAKGGNITLHYPCSNKRINEWISSNLSRLNRRVSIWGQWFVASCDIERVESITSCKLHFTD